jgi:serine protease Do
LEAKVKLDRALLTALLVTGLVVQGCSVARLAVEGSVQERLIAAERRVMPAVVHVKPVKEIYLAGERRKIPVTGSGVIISPEGYVITNSHVAAKARSVKCMLSSKEDVSAEVVGVDEFTDIAVLKLDLSQLGDEVPCAVIGDSDEIRVGDWVIAMGSPHGLSRTVSLGIVSAADRYLGDETTGISPYHTWIQTDAAINRGNSGGPLVNLEGEVVGINSRVLLGATGLGFAIPIKVADEIKNKLIQDGKVNRSWIGLDLQEMESLPGHEQTRGVLIGGISERSPALEAGLAAGDIIVSYAGTPVSAKFKEELPAINKLIADTPVGETVEIVALRRAVPVTFSVTTAAKGAYEGEELECEQWGLTVKEVTESTARLAKLGRKMGVIVSGVRIGGPANNAELTVGAIIIGVDGTTVEDLASFRTLYEKITEQEKELVLLDAKRGAVTTFVLLKRTWDEEKVDE